MVPQRRQALERLVLHATSLRIPVVEVEGGTLTALAGFDGHQGIALAVEPRVYAGIDDVLARAVERGEPPFVLVLDSLEDPQNVGTLLRTAEAAGVHGVLFPTHRQAPLSPAAIKASAGAVEHLLLCPVDDLPGAMSDLRVRGLRIAAAEADAPLTAAQADLRGPLAIVIGSEGQGLSPAMRRRSDVAVRIPMRGAIGSLNAAVAGSILLYAAVAQRDPTGSGDQPARPVGADAWPVRNDPANATDGSSRPGRSRAARGQSVGAPDASDAVGDASATTETVEPVGRRRSTAPAAPAPKPKARTRQKAASTERAPDPDAAEGEPEPEPLPRKPKTRRAAPGAAEPVAPKRASTVPRQASIAPKRGNAAAKLAKPTGKPAKPAARSARGAAKATPAPAEAVNDTPEPDELLPGGPDPA